MSAPALRIMFSVGEVSGDLHAADLARNLRRLQPGVQLFGAGGERMATAGVDVTIDVTATSTFGLLDLWRSRRAHARSLVAVGRMLGETRPDLVVLVDAPGLNFSVARMARRLGIATVYYVPPQTWLWDPHRASRRLRQMTLVMPTFEREAELYRQAGVRIAYRGHPFADLAAAPPDRTEARQRIDAVDDLPVLGLFPGSRAHEIRDLLPVMLDAVDRIEAAFGRLRVVVSVASDAMRPHIERILDGRRRRVTLTGRPRDALAASEAILAASGTVLLEAAALNVPAVMTYRFDRLSYLYARYVLRVPRRLRFYAMPNILADAPVIPELVLDRLTAPNLADAVLICLRDAHVRDRMREGYARIRERFGPPGMVSRAAADVLAAASAARAR